MAPPEDFVPPVLGLRPPLSTVDTNDSEGSARSTARQGLQETRVEKAAWLGVANSLQQLKELQQSAEGAT
jgi:hypothetical protein